MEEEEEGESEEVSDEAGSDDYAPAARARKGTARQRKRRKATAKAKATPRCDSAAAVGAGTAGVATKQGGLAFQRQMEHEAVLDSMRADGVGARAAAQPQEQPVHMAQRMLTLSAQPDKLPCRDEEKEVRRACWQLLAVILGGVSDAVPSL